MGNYLHTFVLEKKHATHGVDRGKLNERTLCLITLIASLLHVYWCMQSYETSQLERSQTIPLNPPFPPTLRSLVYRLTLRYD